MRTRPQRCSSHLAGLRFAVRRLAWPLPISLAASPVIDRVFHVPNQRLEQQDPLLHINEIFRFEARMPPVSAPSQGVDPALLQSSAAVADAPEIAAHQEEHNVLDAAAP